MKKMYNYIEENLRVNSDFEIRTLRKEGGDIDLLIPLDLRTLNLHIEQMPEFLAGRFQFIEIRNIIIRFTTNIDDDNCTIHLLKSVDLLSAIMNFTMNYENHYMEIIRSDYSVEMYLRRKE